MIASRHQILLPHGRDSQKPGFWTAPLLAGLVLLAGVMPASSHGQSPDRFESQRVDVSAARPIHRQRVSKRTSREAPREVIRKPQPVMDPIDEAIEQVGFFDVAYGGCDGGCGPVCDCGSMGPGCGMEGPGCGMETIGGGPGCGMEYCGESCCDGIGCSGCDSCSSEFGRFQCKVPVLSLAWDKMELFVGTQGFRGPMNFANTTANGDRTGDAGSFGFYQGFNRGASLKWLGGLDMAWQFGFRATQANLSGTPFSGETRHQVFLTSGLFRRVDYGFQYGVAVDRLYGDWYYRSNLTQIRGELSWKTRGCHVFGFQFMGGTGSDSDRTSVTDVDGNVFEEDVTFRPTDQYRFFYRQLLGSVGSWEGFLGWTDTDDALIGMNMDFPLSQRWTLNTGATYLNPAENDRIRGPEEEAWNVSVGFTFRPGGNGRRNRYSRPMFNVADNGTFMVDHR